MWWKKKNAGIVEIDMDGIDMVCAAIEQQNERTYASAKQSMNTLSANASVSILHTDMTIEIVSIPVIRW
jgi:hypothetical protein